MANRFRLARALAAAGAACFWAHTSAFAYSIFTVGPAADCPFSTIQAAVDAARDTPGVDYVWISNDLVSGARHDYTGEHVYVNDVDGVIIEGGFISCADPNIDPSDYTTISGASNDGGPVFDISSAGGDVFLGNLLITGANRDDGASGGGISFTGQVGGALLLSNATVSFNHAGYGGGINVNGAAAPAALVLEQNSLILSNSASTSGGGIRLEGNTNLYMLQPETFVAFNDAPGGYGGGVEIIGPAAAHIGSPGYDGAPVIFDNSAAYGGGIAAIGGQNEALDANAYLFTTDPQNPVQVSNNIASQTGGAVYLKPTVTFDFDEYHYAYASLCAFDFRMDDNIAQEGTAIYGDTDTYNLGLDHIGTDATLTTLTSQGCDTAEVACADGVACNTMNGNVAEDTFGSPTPGSTILMQTAGALTIYGLHLHGAEGASAIRTFDVQNDFQNCLVTDNAFSADAFVFENDDDIALSQTTMRGCTIAGNAIGGGAVISSGRNVGLYTSIVDQPGVASISLFDSATATVSYVLAADLDGLPVQNDVVQGSPLYVDAASGDYHLQRTSPGVDFAPRGGGTDLDRQPRDIDLGDIVNVFGPRDLGAFEIQTQLPGSCYLADTVYCDGFDG